VELAGLLADRGDMDEAAQICAPWPMPETRCPLPGWVTCSPSEATRLNGRLGLMHLNLGMPLCRSPVPQRDRVKQVAQAIHIQVVRRPKRA
jgi:hypothetical protein